MRHVSDENSDELFRKAADYYPLKTDSPGWNTMSGKIEDTDPNNNTLQNLNKTNHRGAALDALYKAIGKLLRYLHEPFKRK